MPTRTAIVRHADSMASSLSGSILETKIQYRTSYVDVMVPEKGSRTDVIPCAFCEASLDIRINSRRRATLLYSLKSIPWLAAAVAAGWVSYQMIASDNLTDTLWWIPMLLLWGIAPAIAGVLLHTVVLGQGPTGRIAGPDGNFRAGGKHDVALSDEFNPQWMWTISCATQLLGLALGYHFYVSHWGSDIDGDQLVTLIGVDYNGPEAAKTLQRAGDLNRDIGDNRIYWRDRRFAIEWGNDRKINVISFGLPYTSAETFKGKLPFGLTLGDSEADVEGKLGPALSKTDMKWIGHAKSGHVVEVHRQQQAYNDSLYMNAVVVHESAWQPASTTIP